MWATPTPSADRLLAGIWAVFAGVNVALMWILPGQETVPFHFVWISLALVYGFTSWSTPWMVTALVGVVLSTGAILVHHAAVGEIRWEETAEEPLMTGIFVVMVWHVHRRQELLREVQRIHAAERVRLERRQLFVRLASHELRTPITVARGYTELLREAHTDPTTVEDTSVVLEELDKVTRISQRLVTLMQLDQAHPLSPADIDAELLRILRRWEPTADRDWAATSTVGTARINPERFETALDCLIENAIKFTGPGDRIEVAGWREQHGWVVEVRDSGVGLSPGAVPGLLSGTAGPATSTGTGLGLTIVRGVAASLGGQVMISATPGAGARIGLYVPQPAPGAPAPAAEPAPPAPVIAEPRSAEPPAGDPAPVPAGAGDRRESRPAPQPASTRTTITTASGTGPI
jgi:two-component system OmpR family sensor kinase